MLSALERFFHVASRDPSAAQARREALLDLLLLTMYADNALKEAERLEIRSVAREMPWEGTGTADDYLTRAIPRVRRLSGKQAELDSFLAEIAGRFGDRETKESAVRACRAVAEADGSVDIRESDFIGRLAERLLDDA